MKSRMMLVVMAACSSCIMFGEQFWTATPSGIEAVGDRAVVRLENGRITRLAVRGGTEFASVSPQMATVSGGGVLKRGLEREFTGCHADLAVPMVWSPPLDRARQFYRYPDSRSKLTVSAAPDGGCVVKWKGLAKGEEFFSGDVLTFAVRKAEDGAIAVRAGMTSSSKGVFGMRISVDGVQTNAELVLPVFSGMRFPLNETVDGEAAFLNSGRRLEAPLVIADTGGSTCAMWSEDDAFTPHTAFFRKEKGTAAFSLEFFNPMPFEEHRAAESPEVKFDCFPGGGWIDAAKPYRDWYRRRFAAELAIRDNNGPQDIRVVMSDAIHRVTDAQLDELARDYGGHLLWYITKLTEEFTHTWRWDWMLPGHTPDLKLADRVQAIRKRGIRIAPYVIGHCVNYASPAFGEWKVAELVKPVAMQVANYLPEEQRKKGWSGRATNELVYVDMNFANWRHRVADSHVALWRAFDADTLYEDCLGCVADPGNGKIDGMWGAQGASAFAREMLMRLNRPLMSEFGNAAIAFATMWPLVETANFTDKPQFTEFRKHHQIPLSAYLFGYRPWNSGSHPWLADEARLTLEMACADSTGGLGFVVLPPYGKDRKDTAIFEHMRMRAKLFNDKALKPYFPERGRFPKGVTSMYRGLDGIYSFCDDGKVQTMRAPDGSELYRR